MIQFYAPNIEEDPVLPESESLHCCRVLRMKECDEVIVTDGKGSRFICEILKSHPKYTQLLIKKKEILASERNYRLILAVAPTKNSERIEWLVEKAMEIGVDKIVLLKCQRSERKNLRTDRLLKVMVSAMKQSLGVFLPDLEEVTDYFAFVRGINKDAQKFFGYCSNEYPRKSFVKECIAGGEIVIMIGPEGDFTTEEVEEGVSNGFIPVTFGDKRLRTETAGVYAVSAVNVINQLAAD